VDTSPEVLAGKILENLSFAQGRLPEIATRYDWYYAIALTVRSFMLRRWIATAQAILHRGVRVVGYLSAEYLPGRHLENNLVNLGILDKMRAAVSRLELNFEDILAEEEEPGLGNGGLGRLASCYLDSLATLQIPAIGYGIRYEFGIFDQAIRDGAQIELADEWLLNGNPWEIVRPEIAFDVGFGGRTEWYCDQQGHNPKRWLPERRIRGVAYDTAVSGFKVDTVNILRLWRAEALKAFDLAAFNLGDYFDAVEEKIASENVSKVLYPNDQSAQGRRLRLEQQYFFVSCSLRDMLRIHALRGGETITLPNTFAVQLNDTHPSIAVAELMRLLVDEHGMGWAPAWEATRQTLSYTNHTLLPEALETWPLRFVRRGAPPAPRDHL
jgi:starch phosphorylase